MSSSRANAASSAFSCPSPAPTASAWSFLPVDKHSRLQCEGILERIVREEGLTVLGWRDTPVNGDAIGREARASQPYIQQIFVRLCARTWTRMPSSASSMSCASAPKMRSASPALKTRRCSTSRRFSCRTIIYKGLMLAPQIDELLPRTRQSRCRQRAVPGPPALLHQHLPELEARASLSLRRPQRRNQHPSRQCQLDARAPVGSRSRRSSATTSRSSIPIIAPDGSDSANFDNAVELLLQSGRSLPHVMAMLIPEAWSGNPAHGAGESAPSTSTTPP